MRRAARPLLYAGVLVVVFGLAQVHARYIGHYSFTGTFRFGWTITYAAILCVCAYGFGLPEVRSEEHTSELQSLMRISYAVFCLIKKKNHNTPDSVPNTERHRHKNHKILNSYK